jgi:hypothetical protein
LYVQRRAKVHTAVIKKLRRLTFFCESLKHI